jgi:hypothetical protein
MASANRDPKRIFYSQQYVFLVQHGVELKHRLLKWLESEFDVSMNGQDEEVFIILKTPEDGKKK